MTNQVERPPQDSRLETSEQCSEHRSEHCKELEPAEQLSNALAELEQWFGWGTGSESRPNPSPQDTSLQDTSSQDTTTHTDSNELLLETIDQELDEWEAELQEDSEPDSEPESRTEHSSEMEQDPIGVVDPFAIAQEPPMTHSNHSEQTSSDASSTDIPNSEGTWVQEITFIQDHPLEGLLDGEDLPPAEDADTSESDFETHREDETGSEAENEAESIEVAVIPAPDFEELPDQEETPEFLTYNGPEEILVKTPVILGGTYDKTRAASVTAIAEDKYPFAVILDQTASTWAVDLSEGFYQAGARWLRVQAVDSDHRVLASRIVNLIVSENPLSVGQALKLTVQRDTLFKEHPFDSQELASEARAEVLAGTSFTVQRYGYVDGYLLVELHDSIGDVGSTGYFYASHVELRKGQQLLAFELGQVPVLEPNNTQVWITRDTLLKQRPVDSQSLQSNQMHALTQGEHFEVSGYAAMRGHFRVTLAEEIPGFGQVGYLYPEHVHLNQENEQVAFSPDSLLLSVVEPTVFKKRPVNASNLKTDEKISLSKGQVYGVLHYEVADEGHLNVTLSEALPDFGTQGYLPLDHIQVNRGAQTVEIAASQIELDVSYFSRPLASQRSIEARTVQPESHLPETAPLMLLAMVMDYYGFQSITEGRLLEDELQDWCVNNWGKASRLGQAELVQVAQANGLKASFATDRSWKAVHDRLNQKQPVLLCGQFSDRKHLLMLIGYNSQGYFVHDSQGDALTGYRSTYGRKRFYPKAYLEKMCSDLDGQVWAHFMEPFNPAI